jgi:hypothetical protein
LNLAASRSLDERRALTTQARRGRSSRKGNRLLLSLLKHLCSSPYFCWLCALQAFFSSIALFWYSPCFQTTGYGSTVLGTEVLSKVLTVTATVTETLDAGGGDGNFHGEEEVALTNWSPADSSDPDCP